MKTQQIFEQQETADAQSDLDEKLQQASLQTQQIFVDDEPFEQVEQPSEIEQQSIDSDKQVEQILATQLAAMPAGSANKSKKRSTAIKWLLLILTAIVGVETASFMVDIWSSSPFMAGLYSAALALTVGIAGKVTFKEYRQLKALKQVEKWQQASERMTFAEQVGQATTMCQQISAQLASTETNKQKVTQWHESITEHFTDKEIKDLYSSMVLEDIDNQSLKVISRYAGETALMVAISPMALMDMALVLWRSTRMIDDICQLYGVKLGYWSRIKLIRAVLTNVVYAGASELIADIGSAALGLEVAGKMSARAAQGLGAGLLTGRLGLKVIQLVRPIPAPSDKQKRLGDLSKELLVVLRKAIPGM